MKTDFLLEVNPAWLKMFGYTREEVVGSLVRRFPDGRRICRSFRENFERFKAIGEAWGTQESRWFARTESGFSVEIDGRVGYDNEGNFQQTHCISARHHQATPKPATKSAEATSLPRRFAACSLSSLRKAIPKRSSRGSWMSLSKRPTASSGSSTNCEQDEDGRPYKVSLALSNISWDEKSTELYSKLKTRNLEFRNLSNLAGISAVTGETTISNAPAHDPRAGGLPEGHPALRTFMGIPLSYGGELVGVAGVANRPDGYSKEIAEFLEPLTAVCAGIIHSVRARRREERFQDELRDEMERTQAYLDVAGVMLLALDREGKVALINRRGCEILGCRESEAIGKDWFSHFLPADRREEVRQVFCRMMRGDLEPVENVENLVLCADGSTRTVAWHNALVQDSNGEITGTLTSGEDVTDRKRAEEIAREAALRQELAVQAGNVGLWDWDLRSNKVFYSVEWKRQIGYEDNEIGNDFREWQSRVHPDDILARLKDVEHCIANPGTAFKVEFRFRHKDGSYRWIMAQGRVLADQDGRPTRMVGTHVDITERKLAEETLRESEEKYRLLFDNAGMGIGYFTTDGRVLSFNKTAAERMGGEPEDFVGRSMTDLFGDETGAEYLARIEAALQSDAGNEYEDYVEVPVGGNWFLSTYTRISDAKGRPAGVQVISHDISARKRTEQALARSEEKYRDLVESAQDIIYTLDIEGKITFASPSVEETLGYTPNELLGRSFLELVPGDMKDLALEQFEESLRLGEYASELTLIDKDGRPHTIEYLTSVIEEHGRIVGTRGIVRDITARKRIEAELANSLADSQRRETETAALLVASQSILDSTDFREAARSIFDACKDAIHAASGYVALLATDGSENEVLFLDSGGLPCSVDPDLPMPIRGLRAEAYQRGEVVYDNDFARSEWQVYMPEGHVRLDNVLFAPLTISGKVVGLLGLANKPLGFSAEDARLAAAFGELAAVSLRDTWRREELQASEAKFRQIAETVRDVFWVGSPDWGKVYYVSPAYGETWGRSCQSLLDEPRSWLDAVHADDREQVLSAIEEKSGGALADPEFPEYRIVRPDGSVRWIAARAFPIRDTENTVSRIAGIAEDITERKRSEQARLREETRITALLTLNEMVEAEEPEVADFALEKGILLTDSQIGFLGFMNEDESVMQIHAWSASVMKECAVADKPLSFPIADAGLWGEAVRRREPIVVNDYAHRAEAKKGVPKGHVPVKRFLSIPVLDGERIVAVSAVANKREEYTQEDVRQLTLLTGGMWSLIRRKRHNSELRIRTRVNEIFVRFHGDQVYAEMLRFALELLESEFGTFGYFDRDGRFIAPAITRAVYWDKCDIPDKETVFERGEFLGIWARAVNEKQTHFSNTGPFKTPPGHVPIINTIVAPIVYRDEVISAIHLANKPGGYDWEDVRQLESIAAHVAPVLHARLERDAREEDRKRAAEALHASEEKFRAVFEQAPDSILLIDSETGEIVDFNDWAHLTLGYTKDEFKSLTVADIDAAESPSEVAAHVSKVLDAGQDTFETVQRTKDGRLLNVLVSCRVISLNGHRHFASICTDITERRRMEDDLRKFKTISDKANYGAAISDPEGRLTYVNEAFARMHQYAPEELIGKHLALFHNEEQMPRVRELLEKLEQEGGFSAAEVWHARKDGSVFCALMNATTIMVGDRIGYFSATAVDITERKLAVDRLRESEERFRGLYENSPLGYQSLDENGNFIELNETWCSLLGYTKEEVLGRNFSEFIPPDLREHFIASFPKFKTMGYILGVEFEMVKKDGSEIVVAFDGRIGRHEDGSFKQTHCVLSDVTERKRSEEALARAKEAAETANRAKSQFLANMSHEIRTPMTAIMGYTDLLMSSTWPAEEDREHLKVIKRNSENLLAIISDILDLSKIESEEVSLDLAEVPVREVVEEVRSLMQMRTDEKGLQLNVDFQEPLFRAIRTDPGRLRQILVNLVGNAVKFTEQGSVTITVGSARQDDDGSVKLQFEVADTGIGISSEAIGRLFQPFTQADMTFTRRFGGTGLGLAISQRLAGLLGGRIEVQSQPGKGSTFTLTIYAVPMDKVQEHPALLPDSTDEMQPTATGRPQRLHGCVLLAEDDLDLRALLVRNLVALGLEVDTAEDGRIACKQALKSKAEGRPYDLILMDIQMPELDGHEATRSLRRDGWEGPIVAVTAHAMSGDREKCLEAGCNDYVSKPVTPDELFAVVSRHVRSATPTIVESNPEKSLPRTTETTPSNPPNDAESAALATTFISGLSKRIENMERALNAGDGPLLGKLAHQLKGTAGSFGFPEIAHSAQRLVKEARNEGDLWKLKSTLSELIALCEAVMENKDRSFSDVARQDEDSR